MGLAEAGAQRQQTQCGAGGGRAMVRGCRPLADRLPLPAPPSCAGTDTAGKALEGFDLTGNERHKASLIATLQETLLQREIHVLPMRKGGGERKGGKKKDLSFCPPSTCSDKPPLEAPEYLLLSVKSRLVPGKRSFQVSPEMKGRGNVCENAREKGAREKGEEGKRMREEEERGRQREGEDERMISA